MIFFILTQQNVFSVSFKGVNKASVYLSAHQDDWQGFMPKQVYNEVKSNDTKQIFIQLTAGDAGNGNKNNYYSARNNGLFKSISFVNDIFFGKSEKKTSFIEINEHKIKKIEYRNTVTYLLDLPDGGKRGEGFEENNFQSLKKLRKNKEKLKSIHQSGTYFTIGTLEQAVIKIVEIETENIEKKNIKIHAADPDRTINPNDHSDHEEVGFISLTVAKKLPCSELFLYETVGQLPKPVNLSEEEYQVDVGMFAAYVMGVVEFGVKGNWKESELVYLGRQYSRPFKIENNCQNISN
ncbi:hypothetical protein N9N67_10105 [Bacteriovoracaceae bacterium]|nr:hypothetical protein [Bacteriovoracaceae bacterium]